MKDLVLDRYEAFQERFGTAGVILGVIALVLAIGGSAIAASGKLTPKQKREVKAIAKSFQGTGPAGAAGAAGPAGPAGAKGDNGTDGTNGTNGTNGADGSTVLSGGAPPDDQLDGVDGDFYIDTSTNQIYGPKTAGAWGAPTDLQGSPWTAGGTLPSVGTETGVLMGESPSDGIAAMNDGATSALMISDFNIPLDSVPTQHVVAPDPDSTYGSTADCPGVVPDGFVAVGAVVGIAQADPGHLCIYLGELDPASIGFPVPAMTNVNAAGSPSVSQQGFASKFRCTSPEVGICTAVALWAVTG
jgi:hypothetical protein